MPVRKCEMKKPFTRGDAEKVSMELEREIKAKFPNNKDFTIKIIPQLKTSMIYIMGSDYVVVAEHGFINFIEDLLMKYDLEKISIFTDEENKISSIPVVFEPVNWNAYETFCLEDDVQCLWCGWHDKMLGTHRGFCPQCNSPSIGPL